VNGNLEILKKIYFLKLSKRLFEVDIISLFREILTLQKNLEQLPQNGDWPIFQFFLQDKSLFIIFIKLNPHQIQFIFHHAIHFGLVLNLICVKIFPNKVP